jgi:signal transduction histidine kinase
VGAILSQIRRFASAFVEQGITPSLPDPLKKRIRLTNGLSLFGALVMATGIPYDWSHAPRWTVAQDVGGAVAFLLLPVLNRTGHLLASRLLCVVVANLFVLGYAVLFGPASGGSMVLIALLALPFALFDLSDSIPLAFGVAVSMVCFALVESGVLSQLQDPAATSAAAGYYGYSAVVALAVLTFCLYMTSAANARAEQQLRRDIAERLRAERELEQTRQASIYSAKMAALGEMSGNIGHEINNPLAAILLRAQRLQRLAAKDALDVDVVRSAAGDIRATADRIRRIVDALRSFARDAEKDPMRPESIRDIVSETIELCAQRFRHHSIELLVEPIPADLYVSCRGVQISQVLLNLLGNAHDAVERAPRRWVRVTAEGDAREACIAVTDSGPGIPPELHARIMEPFFTTKELGKGTGLGLSVSKGIAEAHGGRLTYDSEAGETRFVITLPRVPPPPEATRASAWAAPHPSPLPAARGEGI